MNYSEYLDWDDQITAVQNIAKAHSAKISLVTTVHPIVALRDWQGRLHLCIPCDSNVAETLGLRPLIEDFHTQLVKIAWASDLSSNLRLKEVGERPLDKLAIFKYSEDDGTDIWNSSDLVAISTNPNIALLDRQDKNQEWLRQDTHTSAQTSKRVVFYGVKGGVGRSTAISGLALSLGEQSKSVLIVDLDLESPGVSSSLLSTDLLPDYGIVDWFAADSLGLDTEAMTSEMMVETSPLSRATQAKIYVCPSFGATTQGYIRKLGRVFRQNEEGEPYSVRIDRLIGRLEAQYNPDVTLIDCRAGIDDTSAAALTHLGAELVLLFSINTSQTWKAYEILFKHLSDHPSVHTPQDFRFKLQIVSALTPDAGLAPNYFTDMCERSYDVMEKLYDEIEVPSEQIAADELNDGVFSYSAGSEQAPHIPWRIMWDEALRAFDPVSHAEHYSLNLRQKVFGEFTDEASKFLFGS